MLRPYGAISPLPTTGAQHARLPTCAASRRSRVRKRSATPQSRYAAIPLRCNPRIRGLLRREVLVMRFAATELSGPVVVELEPHTDERGTFARLFCREEFDVQGLDPAVAQVNLASSARAGTVRGLHYQAEPMAESKLVRCVRGSLFDVAVDVRPASPTYLRHVVVELTARSLRALYVPTGFAHGYQTCADDTEILYLTSQLYSPRHERGLRHDDPALAISWPLPVSVISDKDARWPLVVDDHAELGQAR